MKEKFENPEMELIEFEAENVISVSCGTDDSCETDEGCPYIMPF